MYYYKNINFFVTIENNLTKVVRGFNNSSANFSTGWPMEFANMLFYAVGFFLSL
jgi:hypothetical protein